MKKLTFPNAYHPWPACSMRSWWLTRGRKTARGRLPRSSGRRVFDFVWVDDFAAARNAALARATGDYAFWLDADDVVDPPEREKLRQLLEGLQSDNGDSRGVPVGLARRS